MRFSLKTLLATFTFAAISCVALLNANAVWAMVFTTGAFFCCCFGALAAMVNRGGARAFWIGFAVFGWSYFWFSMNEREVDPSGKGTVVSLGSSTLSTEPRLVTTKLLIWVQPFVRKLMNLNPAWYSMRWFVEVGHAILTALLAVAGGWLGIWLAGRERRSDVAS